MSDITYTFPVDCPIPELRGVTATGGKFCRLDGKFDGGEPDAVRFREPHINGKELVARIAGKPELESALAAKLADRAAREAVLAAISWPAYEAALREVSNANGAYERASNYGYPAKEAARLQRAEAALDQARSEYPAAALYAKAVAYSESTNDIKSGIGERAKTAIEQGADVAETIAAMEAEWSVETQKRIWD